MKKLLYIITVVLATVFLLERFSIAESSSNILTILGGYHTYPDCSYFQIEKSNNIDLSGLPGGSHEIEYNKYIDINLSGFDIYVGASYGGYGGSLFGGILSGDISNPQMEYIRREISVTYFRVFPKFICPVIKNIKFISGFGIGSYWWKKIAQSEKIYANTGQQISVNWDYKSGWVDAYHLLIGISIKISNKMEIAIQDTYFDKLVQIGYTSTTPYEAEEINIGGHNIMLGLSTFF
jgi:hypothetical protein